MSEEKIILQLIIVRHARSWGNVDNEKYSRELGYYKEDPPLSDMGLLQAKLLGDRLAMGHIDALFSSPLTRTIETAHEIASAREDNLSIFCLADLLECDTLPGFAGCSHEKIHRLFPEVIPEISEPTITGGMLSLSAETPESKKERASRVVNYMKKNYCNGETVVLVTHGGFIEYLVRNILGIADHEGYRISSNNSSVTKFKFYDNGKVKQSYANDTSHLYILEKDMAFTI